MEEGRKQRIGIFGGSFDPITKGHIEVTKFVMSKTDLDEIWLMPCNDHIFKKDQTSALSRFSMCQLACQWWWWEYESPNITTSNYEILHKLNGSVYDLFQTLSKDPNMQKYEFSFIIGSDNVVIFDQWKKSEELKKSVRFITVPRKGVKIPKNITWHKELPHIFLEGKTPIIEVSSTQIRKILYRRLMKRLSSREVKKLNSMIDAKVLDYIERRQLYMRGEDEQGKQRRV